MHTLQFSMSIGDLSGTVEDLEGSGDEKSKTGELIVHFSFVVTKYLIILAINL